MGIYLSWQIWDSQRKNKTSNPTPTVYMHFKYIIYIFGTFTLGNVNVYSYEGYGLRYLLDSTSSPIKLLARLRHFHEIICHGCLFYSFPNRYNFYHLDTFPQAIAFWISRSNIHFSSNMCVVSRYKVLKRVWHLALSCWCHHNVPQSIMHGCYS